MHMIAYDTCALKGKDAKWVIDCVLKKCRGSQPPTGHILRPSRGSQTNKRKVDPKIPLPPLK